MKVLVDLVGIEPTTSSMPWKRAPSCATGPLLKNPTHQDRRKSRVHSRPHHGDSQRADSSGSGAVWFSTRKCHPERSRFSGGAKDLLLNRLVTFVKLHQYHSSICFHKHFLYN